MNDIPTSLMSPLAKRPWLAAVTVAIPEVLSYEGFWQPSGAYKSSRA